MTRSNWFIVISIFFFFERYTTLPLIRCIYWNYLSLPCSLFLKWIYLTSSIFTLTFVMTLLVIIFASTEKGFLHLTIVFQFEYHYLNTTVSTLYNCPDSKVYLTNRQKEEIFYKWCYCSWKGISNCLFFIRYYTITYLKLHC